MMKSSYLIRPNPELTEEQLSFLKPGGADKAPWVAAAIRIASTLEAAMADEHDSEAIERNARIELDKEGRHLTGAMVSAIQHNLMLFWFYGPEFKRALTK